MNPEKIKNIIEAMIMVSEAPISAAKLYQLIDNEDISEAQIKSAIELLQQDYCDRGVRLFSVASGYRFQAASEYKDWFHLLLHEKPHRYSKALLETLAIIAYRQPVTRADVEAIRGVAVSSSIMKTLMEREWVRIVGYRDVPGKPAIYSTTKVFLDYFNLKSLSELPPLNEIKDLSSLMKEGDQALEKSEEILNHLESKNIESCSKLNQARTAEDSSEKVSDNISERSGKDSLEEIAQEVPEAESVGDENNNQVDLVVTKKEDHIQDISEDNKQTINE